jgi:cytochrome P450
MNMSKIQPIVYDNRMPLDALDPSLGVYFEQGIHHEIFARLRREAPVHYSKTGPSGPFWSVTRHADIMAVDTNHKVFSSNRDVVIGDQPQGFAPTSFIQKDPPIHDIQRKAVLPAVAPTQLAELEGLIRKRAGAILDQLPINEEFNWVDRVSIELTTQMLTTFFDFPWEDRRLLPYWSDIATAAEMMGNTVASMEERQRILLTECLPYFSGLWRERARQPPKFDFLSLLAHSPDTSNMIDDPVDFLGNLMVLLVGGNDTTRNSITASVYTLNKFPREYEKLTANPALIPNFVSEVIRWQSPIANMRRTAVEDVELRGQKIKAGERVVMWYVSGNRDESVFDRPDDLVVDRANARRHLSFGFGIHRCLGNRAAELQLRVLWEEILARFKHIEVLGEPRRVLSNTIMGYTALPVRIHA